MQQDNSKELMIRERYTQVNLDESAYTHGLAEQNVCIRTHASSQKERRVHVGNLFCGLWYLVHGILVLVHGIWSEVLTPGIGSKVLVLCGFGPWY